MVSWYTELDQSYITHALMVFLSPLAMGRSSDMLFKTVLGGKIQYWNEYSKSVRVNQMLPYPADCDCLIRFSAEPALNHSIWLSL